MFFRPKAFPLLLAVVLLAASQQIFVTWQVNVWSLAFARPALSQGLKNTAIPDPLAVHRRSTIWLAQQALARGDALRGNQPWLPALQAAAAEDALAARTLGQVLWAQGQTMDAIQTWLHARDYPALLNAARQAQAVGRLEDALSAYRAARVVDSQKGTLPLVNFLWQIGSRGTAEALLRQALALKPEGKFAVTWQRHLADFMRAEKRWDEAIVLYQQVLAAQPDDFRAYIGLGWVYYERGDGVEAALKSFSHAIALSPEKGDGYFAIGQIMEREERYAEADSWFAQALQHNPDNRGWQLERANNLRAAGNLDGAMRLYEDTIAYFPDWAPAYYEMAWNYRLMGRPAEAMRAIDSALSLAGEMPEAWYFVRAGQIYEWGGKQDVALGFYNKALQLAPENKIALQGMKRLGK
ncbi:MAG: tetratricopeptide repeat protein [Calditrichaeota bacterium]|nr:MAG: tetratricopeptide repeat protein [Calditrichota bacterium]